MCGVLTSPPERYRQNRICTTVVFYGPRDFERKTMQSCARQREDWIPEMPSFCNAAQAGEKQRKNSLLNYESPALTAELQAQLPMNNAGGSVRLDHVASVLLNANHSAVERNRHTAKLLAAA
jgi:hypothetical protein